MGEWGVRERAMQRAMRSLGKLWTSESWVFCGSWWKCFDLHFHWLPSTALASTENQFRLQPCLVCLNPMWPSAWADIKTHYSLTDATLDDNFRRRINNSFNQHLSLQFSVPFLARGSVATDWFWGWAKCSRHSSQLLGGYFLFLNYLIVSLKLLDLADCDGAHLSCTQLTPPVPKPRSADRPRSPSEWIPTREEEKKRINSRSGEGLYPAIFFL